LAQLGKAPTETAVYCAGAAEKGFKGLRGSVTFSCGVNVLLDLFWISANDGKLSKRAAAAAVNDDSDDAGRADQP
jgi:hypothetical protein